MTNWTRRYQYKNDYHEFGGLCSADHSIKWNVKIIDKYNYSYSHKVSESLHSYTNFNSALSVLIPLSWMMRNVLNRMKNQFSDLYFSSYREKFIESCGDDVTKWPKNDHNSKNKNRKNLKFYISFYSADFWSFMQIWTL